MNKIKSTIYFLAFRTEDNQLMVGNANDRMKSKRTINFRFPQMDYKEIITIFDNYLD